MTSLLYVPIQKQSKGAIDFAVHVVKNRGIVIFEECCDAAGHIEDCRVKQHSSVLISIISSCRPFLPANWLASAIRAFQDQRDGLPITLRYTGSSSRAARQHGEDELRPKAVFSRLNWKAHGDSHEVVSESLRAE